MDVQTFHKRISGVAAEIGYSPETIAWILCMIVAPDAEFAFPASIRPGLNAESLCDSLIRQTNEDYPGDLRIILEANDIFSSRDLGVIVNSLVRNGLLVRDMEASLTNFQGIFSTDELGEYLARRGIQRRWLDWPGVKRRLAISLCGIGVALVAAAHFRLIPQPYLLGFVVTVTGVVLALVPPHPMRAKPEPQE